MWRFLDWLTPAGRENRALRAALAAVRAAGDEPAVASGPGWAGGPAPSLVNAGAALDSFTAWTYAAVRPIAQRIAGQPVRVARKVSKGGLQAKSLRSAPNWLKQTDANLEILPSHAILDALADPGGDLAGWSHPSEGRWLTQSLFSSPAGGR